MRIMIYMRINIKYIKITLLSINSMCITMILYETHHFFFPDLNTLIVKTMLIFSRLFIYQRILMIIQIE